ncbi:hypothetical protein GQ42DRAFT_164529 [Ramicandelaber brevisporus]|nr:hypothetical protein GQ42DRAFT_164529 [Ramicandelaber brevisporus]
MATVVNTPPELSWRTLSAGTYTPYERLKIILATEKLRGKNLAPWKEWPKGRMGGIWENMRDSLIYVLRPILANSTLPYIDRVIAKCIGEVKESDHWFKKQCAGLARSVAVLALTTPLNTVLSVMGSDEEGYIARGYLRVFRAIRTVYQHGGVSGFYAGFSYDLAGITFVRLVTMSVYNAKEYLIKDRHAFSNPIVRHVTNGSIAILSNVATYPLASLSDRAKARVVFPVIAPGIAATDSYEWMDLWNGIEYMMYFYVGCFLFSPPVFVPKDQQLSPEPTTFDEDSDSSDEKESQDEKLDAEDSTQPAPESEASDVKSDEPN